MPDDLISILTRFHREVLLPDLQRVVGDLRAEMNQRFASLDGHFDAIYQRSTSSRPSTTCSSRV